MMLAYWTHAIERDGWIGEIGESTLSSPNMKLRDSDCVWLIPGTDASEKYRPRNRLENP
jgi:hypothetical protein